MEMAEEHLLSQGFTDRQVDEIISERIRRGYIHGDLVVDEDPNQDYD
jgi:hypothetical protein